MTETDQNRGFTTMRQRPPTKVSAVGGRSISSGISSDSDISDNSNNSNRNRNGQAKLARRAAKTRQNGLAISRQLFFMLLLFMATVQLILNSVLYESSNQKQDPISNYLRTNSYDVLLKNTIHYSKNDDESSRIEKLQEQIENLRSQISTLESKSQKYIDDPLFFPFVIRDSRHLTPVQIDPDFHTFDYVDLTQAKQPKSKHSQLLHNARLVADEPPCQEYSLECYAQKILQVFSYVLREFPSVEYYFYIEADNDLCVPMTMVKDLALKEKRYFISTGIGFSGWIMSREFLEDFVELYSNATRHLVKNASTTKLGSSSESKVTTARTSQQIGPDVLASFYLIEKNAWTVTRQYWVSHTTLESLGTASLTVKDRRKVGTGERMQLDKHLPRCLEPRRSKWKVNKQLDPRDRFGWDYFDYEACPDDLLFPCKGEDQLKKLVEDDWRVAKETGALARQKRREEKHLLKQVEDSAQRKEQEEAAKKMEKATNLPPPAHNNNKKADTTKLLQAMKHSRGQRTNTK